MFFASLAVVLVATGMLIFVSVGIIAEPCYAAGSEPDRSNAGRNDISSMAFSGISDTVYNGEEQKLPVVITDDQGKELTEGEDYELSYSEKTRDGETTSEIRNAGLVTVTIQGKGSYSGSLIATYMIKPAPLSIETSGAEKEYDGTALTASGKITGLIGDEAVTFATTGTITDAGSVPNGYEIRWDDTAEAMNYVIAKEKIGTLKVTPATEDQNSIDAESYIGTYDGKEHPITVKAGLEGSEISYSTDGGGHWYPEIRPFKDAMDGPIEVMIKAVNPNYAHGTAQVTVAVMIHRAKLTVTTNSAARSYDGTALTASGELSGLVDGETADFRAAGSQTDIGSSLNTYELLWTGGTQDNAANESNYEIISEHLGTLQVAPTDLNSLTVSDISDTIYNGEVQKLPVVIKNDGGKELTEGPDYELSYSEQTAAGKTDVIRDTGDVTVTITGKGSYFGTVTVSYKIKPATLVIETFSAEKEYDGEALTASGKITGLIGEETVTFVTIGTITDAGSVTNTYEIRFAEDDPEKATARKDNYKIEEHLGTLTVTEPAPVPATNSGGDAKGTEDSKEAPTSIDENSPRNEGTYENPTGVDDDDDGDVEDDNSKDGSGSRDNNTVKTGDEEMPGLWIMLMITATILLAVLVRFRVAAARDKKRS